MTAAQRHAPQAGATEIGTDHLLAGLLADGVAAATLGKLGVTTDAITAAARRLFGPPHPASSAAPPLSAEAACAIEAAAHHATAATAHRPDLSVDTEHLLLVLALDPGSRARRVLADLGADIATIKKELACHITGTPHRPPNGPAPPSPAPGLARSAAPPKPRRGPWSTAPAWPSVALAPTGSWKTSTPAPRCDRRGHPCPPETSSSPSRRSPPPGTGS